VNISLVVFVNQSPVVFVNNNKRAYAGKLNSFTHIRVSHGCFMTAAFSAQENRYLWQTLALLGKRGGLRLA
jgi:hypothetical protein